MNLNLTAKTAALYILAIAPEGRPFNVGLMLAGRDEHIKHIEAVLERFAGSSEQGIELHREKQSFVLKSRGYFDVYSHSHPALDTPDWLEIRKLIDSYFGRLAERKKLN